MSPRAVSGALVLGLFPAISGRSREHGDRNVVGIILGSVRVVAGSVGDVLKGSYEQPRRDKGCRTRLVGLQMCQQNASTSCEPLRDGDSPSTHLTCPGRQLRFH